LHQAARIRGLDVCAEISKSLISSLAGRLDAELAAWRSRPLEAAGYPYLFVDARYEKVRVGGRVVSQGVLVVSAVREPDGFREILAVEVADTESEATYQDLFRSLKARGLRGVELVVSDDHKGLKAAIERYFQGASWQRCQVHYARNLLGMVGVKKRKELAAELRAIFAATSREQALRIASEVAHRWRGKGHEKIACSLKSTSRSASLAWPSRSPTAAASAPQTASRDSTRS
jgi:transposase-like protein